MLYFFKHYREYYRDRPRGEFLTRGAALASQQPISGNGSEYQSLGSITPTAGSSARGSLASHLDSTGIAIPPPQVGSSVGGTIYSVTQRAPLGGNSQSNQNQQSDQHDQLDREPRRYVSASGGQHDQLVRANLVGGTGGNMNARLGGKDKTRNPTILRKSKFYFSIMYQIFTNTSYNKKVVGLIYCHLCIQRIFQNWTFVSISCLPLVLRWKLKKVQVQL